MDNSNFQENNQSLGIIVSGSLSEGLIMRINHSSKLQNIKTGKFLCIKGTYQDFFSIITDIKLEVTNSDILLYPPTPEEKLLEKVIYNTDIYATATLRPMIGLNKSGQKVPIKTIPTHFTPVFEATDKDIKLIFGDENDKSNKYFNIGAPIDLKAPVCIDLEKLTERSSSVFGKTGTGKTFLTRLILAGILQKNKAVSVIFDMHSEYGLQAIKEGNDESFVKGLKTLFPEKVAIFSLDPKSTRRRGGSPDVELNINYDSIEVEDIISLNSELNLHSTAYEAAYLIAAKYKKKWLEILLSQDSQDLKEFAQEVGAHPESIAALYRKLNKLNRLPFLQSSGTLNNKLNKGAKFDVIDQMIEYIDNSISIIIEFGNYTSTFCYLLIANIITRRIHKLYTKKTEQFLGSKNKSEEPQKLIIAIEEAHKFLNPQISNQTIFGTIAREMRKYYVSLLIIDQRPSGIDPEVLSQIGTKVIAQLNDEKDIQAALTGAANSQQLRTVLSGLESKKQVLLLGHAIAMPIVIESRSYDEEFYNALNIFSIPIDKAKDKLVRDKLINEMF